MDIDTSERKGKISKWRYVTFFAITLAAMCAAFLLYKNLSHYDYREVVTSITSISYGSLSLAIAAAGASYLCLTGFDYLALQYVKKPLPYSVAAFVSFVSLSIGHNVGISFLSSGTIRYRFYSRAGLSFEEVGKVILFCGTTVGLGLATLAGVALLVQSDVASDILSLPRWATILIGSVCVALSALYVAAAVFVRKPLRIRKISTQMPHWRLAVGQIGIGTLNFVCVAACLYSAVAAYSETSFFAVATVYSIANFAALVSHVPGGLGVIESVVLYLLPGVQLIGAVLVFRFVYFLLPLALGGTLFALSEVWLARRRFQSER